MTKYKTTISAPKMITCSACGRAIEQNAAYCVIKGPKKLYYCSKEECDGGTAYVLERKKKEAKLTEIVKEIVCYDQDILDCVFNTSLFETILFKWERDASVAKIYSYLYEKQEDLRYILSNKQIDNVTNRLKYLGAVVLNNLSKYSFIETQIKTDCKTEISDKIDIDTYRPKLTPRKGMRRSMEDLENIYGKD